MKIQKSKMFSVVMAVLLVAALTLPVFAVAPVAPQYDNPGQLFSQHVIGDESVKSTQYSTTYSSDSGYSKITTDEVQDLYQRRIASADIEISKDTILGEQFIVEIPKGVTLTIKEGATLTVYGILSIEGEMVNDGKILIGYPTRVVASNRSATIDNLGQVTNNGSLYIRCGKFVNNAGATLENQGKLNITNSTKSVRALHNMVATTNGKTKVGEIVNEGEINVMSTAGIGIYSHSGAKITNNGDITRTAGAIIEGKIKGNEVVVSE